MNEICEEKVLQNYNEASEWNKNEVFDSKASKVQQGEAPCCEKPETEGGEETKNDELIKKYLRMISKIESLSFEKEQEYAKLAKIGDKLAKNKLVRANLKLVVNIAKKSIHVSNLPLIDLIQEGNIGLMVAVDKFNPDLGYKFSTYATWWVKQAMFKAISEQSYCMKIPVYIQETLSKYKKTQSQLEAKYGCQINSSVVCKAVNISQDKIDTYLNAYTRAISLEGSYELNSSSGDNSMSFSEIIEDKNQNLVEKIENEQLKTDIMSAINILKDREKEVITLRFGFGEESDCSKKTLEEIGNIYGVTKECIRQIEKRALNRIYCSNFCKQLLSAYVM